jgi:hypothetical protein
LRLGIIELRQIKVVLLILMIFSVFKLTKLEKKFTALLFLSIGLFCMYSLFGQSLSYNNIIFFLIFVYLVIYLKLNRENYYPIFFLLGIIVGLMFYPKFTSSIALFAWTFILLIFSIQNTIKSKIVSASLFSFGFFIIHGLVYLLSGENMFLNVILNALDYSSLESNYQKSEILASIVSALRWIIVILVSGWFLGIAMSPTSRVSVKLLSVILSFLLLSYFFLAHNTLSRFRFFEYSITMYSLFVLGFLISSIEVKEIIGKKFWLYSTLFILPFIAFIGTNVYVFKFLQLFVFFYFFLIILFLDKARISKIVKSWVLISLTVLLILRIISNVLLFPFNQPSLFSEFTEVHYEEGKKIKLEVNHARYIFELRRMLDKHISPNQPVIGLYALPGDILLAGYQNFYNPCIWSEIQWKFLSSKMKSEGLDKFPYVLTDNIKSVSGLYPNYLMIDSVSNYLQEKLYLIDIN